MKEFVTVVAIFLFFLFSPVAGISEATEQQIIFCLEQYKNAPDTYYCEKKCTEEYKSCSLNQLLSDGWLVITSSQKENVIVPWESTPGQYLQAFNNMYVSPKNAGCSCIGTQYVLRKEDKQLAGLATAKVAVSDTEVALLNKEIELLKKENEMLKKENESFKKKSKAKQKSKTAE